MNKPCSKYSEIFSSYNEPLFETTSFSVIPSLGSLVEGWLLIIPKEYYLNFRHIPVHLYDELERLIRNLRILLHKQYGNAFLFEHGPSQPNSKVGCSIDYAHLHLVPLGFDLFKAACNYNSSIHWTELKELEDLKNYSETDKEYFFIEQPNGDSFLAFDFIPTDQFFRRIIAHKLGMGENFNWRRYSKIDIVETTIQKLSPIKLAVQ